jgi:hypothetical protein
VLELNEGSIDQVFGIGNLIFNDLNKDLNNKGMTWMK